MTERSVTTYTQDQKNQALVEYSIVGVQQEVADNLGINPTTLHGWINSDWGNDMLQELRRATTIRMGAIAQDLYFKATQRTLEALPEATAAQAATIGAIYFDKYRLAGNEPTSIKSDGGVDAMIKAFKDIAAKHSPVYEVVNKDQEENK